MERSKRWLLNDMEVARFMEEQFHVKVKPYQIIPGYVQDIAKTKPRQPVWRIMSTCGTDVYVSMLQEMGAPEGEFYPDDVHDGYILPHERGYIYLAVNTAFKKIYRLGCIAGVSYYDLSTHVPGR